MDITEVNVLCITALHIITVLRDLSVDCAAVTSSLTHTCERFAVARKWSISVFRCHSKYCWNYQVFAKKVLLLVTRNFSYLIYNCVTLKILNLVFLFLPGMVRQQTVCFERWLLYFALVSWHITPAITLHCCKFVIVRQLYKEVNF